MTNTNPLIKSLIGLLNGVLGLAFVAAFAFATIFSVFLFISPLQGVMIEVPLLIFTVVSGTYVAWQSAQDAQKKALEKVRMQEAAGGEVDAGDREAATVPITPFAVLLKRNALVAVFYAPLVAVITGMAFGMMTGILLLTREVAENRTGASAMIRLLIPIPLFGWFIAVGYIWGPVTRFVDQRILHIKINLPESEESRQKRQMREALNGGRKAMGLGGCLSGIGRFVGSMVVGIGPLLLLLLFMNISAIPEAIRIIVGLGGMLAYLGVGVFLMPKLMFRGLDKKIEAEAQKAIDAETDREAAAKMREEFEAYKSRRRASENSVETRTMNRAFVIFMVMIGIVLAAGIGVSYAVRASGGDVETGKNAAAFTMLAGVVIMIVVGGFVAQRFMPKTSKGEALLVGYEAALRGGDYQKLIPMVDEAMRKMPNWETQIPGAAAYVQAGRLKEGEQLTRSIMQDVMDARTDVQREMRKMMMGHLFGLLAEIQLAEGRLDEAGESVRRALEYGDNGYAINNTAAKLNLYRRSPDTALTHIETAEKSYRKEGKPVTMYNVALRAWALALKREFAQAEKLMTQAIKETPTAHVTDLAELYLIGSHVLSAEGKQEAARRSLEKAQVYDRYGVYGIIAQRELDEMR